MGTGYEIARAAEQLIAEGHSPELVWTYTPRQLFGWMELGQRRRRTDLSQLLSLLTLANSQNAKAIKSLMKKLNEESQ